MNLIRTIASELIGLFVDDGLFAAAVVISVVLVALVVPAIGIPAPWRGILLFAGLAAVLIESVARRARLPS